MDRERGFGSATTAARDRSRATKGVYLLLTPGVAVPRLITGGREDFPQKTAEITKSLFDKIPSLSLRISVPDLFSIGVASCTDAWLSNASKNRLPSSSDPKLTGFLLLGFWRICADYYQRGNVSNCIGFCSRS